MCACVRARASLSFSLPHARACSLVFMHLLCVRTLRVQGDITKDEQSEAMSLPLARAVPEGSLSFITMVFVLSAISPEVQQTAEPSYLQINPTDS